MKGLQVFEKHPTADAYRVGGFYSPHCLVSKEKRFADSELAAEGYKMQSEMLSLKLHQADLVSEGDIAGAELFETTRWRKVEQMNTLHRFATLPHYDEQ